MRIRTAKIAITPVWVIKHPEVFGNATRMAVYAGLQVVAFESSGTEWRSGRELAASIAEVVGVGSEACRKHLAALRRIGALVILDDGDVYLAQDDPALGIGLGTGVPADGFVGTQTGSRTTTAEKEKKTPDSDGYGDEPEELELSSPAGPTPGQIAHRLMTAYWQRARERTGRDPLSLKPVALVTLLTPFAEAGIPPDDIDAALRHIYDRGYNPSKPMLEALLDGRGRKPQNEGSLLNLDLFNEVIDELRADEVSST